MTRRLASLLCCLLPGLAAGCATGGARPEAKPEKPVLIGEVSRDQVEATVPDWVEAEVAAEIDAEAARALAAVEPGGKVTVYFGTWCSDSKRELARLWRAFDEIGGEVPFEIHWIGVDRDKKEPADLVAGADLRYVPTFVVVRDGREVGRIVETSPHGIENDLLALLTGQASGVLSASRPELAAAGG
jgi:hypothetical protein